MNRFFRSLLIIFFTALFLATAAPALAQSEFTLNVHRNFGFSSGSQIRGSFTAPVVGGGPVARVVFLIDGKVMVETSTEPYKLDFQTSAYPSGWHELSAEIHLKDGRTLATPVRRLEFVSAAQESESMQKILFPTLGGLFALIAGGMALQFLFLRNRPRLELPYGVPRKYGFNGGGVCPRCNRPFALHWWGLNSGFKSKYDRCDFCGKWSVVKRLSAGELAEAELAELKMAQPETMPEAKSEEEQLKELIDNSRYIDQ